jgi:hypothetical protein
MEFILFQLSFFVNTCPSGARDKHTGILSSLILGSGSPE